MYSLQWSFNVSVAYRCRSRMRVLAGFVSLKSVSV